MKLDTTGDTTISGIESFWSESALTTHSLGHKLDADDYYAEDLDGVTENLFGSGNLNYLIMQVQQSHESLNVLDENISNVDDNQIVQNGFVNANDAAFGASCSDAFTNGVFNGSGLDGFFNGQQSNVTNNGAGGTTMSLASIGGSAAENSASVANNNAESTVNNYFTPPTDFPDPTDDGPPNEPPTNPNGQEPFLDLDTDLELGDTVDDVLNPVGDIVDGALDDVGTILTGGVDELPGNVLDTTTNLVDGTQDLIDATQGVVQGVVEAGTFVVENLSLTDPISNLDNIQDGLSNLLGTNELGLNLDIRDVLEVDTGITFGDDTLPDVSLTLSPEVLGMGPITLSTNDILDQTGLNDVVDGVDSTVQTLMAETPLGDVLGTTEDVLGGVTEGVGEQLDTLAAGADTLIDSAQDTVDDVVDGVMEPLGDVADATGELLSPVQDIVEDVVEPVGDLVADTVGDTVGGVLDGLGLMGDGTEEDTDLNLDLGLGVGDTDLGIAENIVLDPVEDIIGDVDINLLADGDSDGISDLDLTVDGDLFDGVGNLLGLGDEPYVGDGDGGSGDDDGVEGTLGLLGGLVDGATDVVTEDIPENLDEGLTNVTQGLEDTVDNLLGADNNGDTDLVVDADAEATLEDVGLGDVQVGDTSLGDVGAAVDAAGEVILDPVEDVVGDIDIDVGLDADPMANGLDDISLDVDTDIDLVEATQDVAGAVVDPVEGDVEDLVEGVEHGVEQVTDGLNDILASGENSGDTDLTVDVGLEAGDLAIDVAEELILDPVESIIGDVDVGLEVDLDNGGLGAVDADVSTDLLGAPESEALISDLNTVVETTTDGAEDLLTEVAAGTEEAIGDLLPGDGPTLDDLLSGESVMDILPDPGGSADEGLAGLLSNQEDGGGFAGLF